MRIALRDAVDHQQVSVRRKLALAELGRSAGPDPVPIGELARRREVPVQFLEQLFAVLRRAGVISSQLGVSGGGYRFAREPASVTVLEIVELLGRPPRSRRAEGVFADAATAARKKCSNRPRSPM